MYRYLVIEYCFDDESCYGKKNVLGSYEDMKSARVAAGGYITNNVEKMKKKYRCWQVKVQRELVFFPIKGV